MTDKFNKTVITLTLPYESMDNLHRFNPLEFHRVIEEALKNLKTINRFDENDLLVLAKQLSQEPQFNIESVTQLSDKHINLYITCGFRKFNMELKKNNWKVCGRPNGVEVIWNCCKGCEKNHPNEPSSRSGMWRCGRLGGCIWENDQWINNPDYREETDLEREERIADEKEGYREKHEYYMSLPQTEADLLLINFGTKLGLQYYDFESRYNTFPIKQTHRAVLTFLWCSRQEDFSLGELRLLPMELVLIIARKVWDSRMDINVWWGGK